MIINEFKGQYSFLSNFHFCKIKDKIGRVWPSSEHLYQAMKTKNKDIQEKVLRHAPKGLKAFARSIDLRPDWNEIKDNVMYRACLAKFKQNPDLREKLCSIEGTLIEGNYWHDNYWGNCYCEKCSFKLGKNKLGKILMKVRDELKKKNMDILNT